MASATIPFYFGLGSRYSYLAATQLPRIEAETGCRFEWLPLQSGLLITRANRGRTPFDGSGHSGQYDWSYRQRDAEAWADFYGVPFREPVAFETDPADPAKACWAAARDGKLEAMSRHIFQAVFVDAQAITRGLLATLAEGIGLKGTDVLAALDDPAIAARHDRAVNRALADGAFGVPSFVVAGQVYWGNDRLPLVAHALKARG